MKSVKTAILIALVCITVGLFVFAANRDSDAESWPYSSAAVISAVIAAWAAVAAARRRHNRKP